MCTKFRKNLRKWVFTKQFYWGTVDTTAHVENGACDKVWHNASDQHRSTKNDTCPAPPPHPPIPRHWQLSGGAFWMQCWEQAQSSVCTVGGPLVWEGGKAGRWSMAWTGGGWRAASDSDGPLKGHEQDRSLDALIFQKRHSGLCVDSLSSDGDLVGGCSLEVVAQDRASFLCKLGCAPWSTSWGPVLYFPGRRWRWLETMNALGVWVSVSASSAWFWRYCSYASALLLLHVGVLWLSLGF